jgi:hypothetical protein
MLKNKPIIIFFFTLFVLLFARSIFFEKINTKSFYDFDEARYAEIAKNHFKTNIWLIPQAGGPDDFNTGTSLRPYFWKPPLHTWIISLSFKIFGQSEFSARLPSFIFSFLSLVIIYLISKILFANNIIGLLAITLLASANDYSYISSQGIAESQLLFFSLLSIYFLLCKKPKIIHSSISISLAFMTKSFGVFWLYPICLYLIFKNSKNKYSDISKWLIIQSILILPWHIYMYILFKNDFITNYVIVNTIGRGTGQQSNIAPIYWYIKYALWQWRPYLIISLIAFLPLLKNIKKHLFLILWMSSIFIPYSLIKSKVWWYIYPFWIPFLLLLSQQLLNYLPKYKLITTITIFAIIIFTNINTFQQALKRTDWNRGIKIIASRNQDISNLSVYQIPYESPLYYFDTGTISREIKKDTQYIITNKDWYQDLTQTNLWQIADKDLGNILLKKITPILTPTPNISITCDKLIKESSLTEPKNFFWLNENKEIEYIKGFSIYLENKDLEKYYKQCLKENFKCHLFHDSLICGKEIQKDENSQIVLDLYKQNYPKESNFEPSRTIDIIKKVDNFIDVSFGENGGGVRSLMKWEENKWKTLKISQEGLFCEDMKKYNIPADFFRKNICYSHEEKAYYKYNETSQKWEPTNEKDY